jgi:hypothetical protein
VCWYYEDTADLHSSMASFLAEGIALGQQVCVVATEESPELIEQLERLAGRRPDAVQSMSVRERYATDDLIDPPERVDAYAEATERARAAGFTGLRVAAEVTELVRTPEQREAFAYYEHLADRYMVSNPFSAMCAYDRRVLGGRAVAELACLHPKARDGATAFHLYAVPSGVALRGELDLSGRSLLPYALHHVELVATDGEITVDARGVRFIDHRSLLALTAHVRGLGATLVFRTSWPGAARLVKLLGLEGVRVDLC